MMEEGNPMQSVLQETLQEWLDRLATLQIDIVGMYDIMAPHATSRSSATPSTLFLLDGEPAQLAKLWQLTKQLEVLPLVSSWEEGLIQIAPQEYHWLFPVILAVASDQWSFLQETEMSGEDSE
jgi:hypothetical protein